MTTRPRATNPPNPLTALGPGILFAGAAIGVSHLIQATRAGAAFGLSLLLLVILVHILKYPALSFGPRYAAATGNHLLHAYKRQGNWAVAAFLIVQLGTAFTIVAAVTIVTAQVTLAAITTTLNLSLNLSLTQASAIVLAACALLLATGGYTLLERIMKPLMAFMFLATIAAAAAVLPDLIAALRTRNPVEELTPDITSAALLAFAIPLLGWMPAPLDISVWNSLWCTTRAERKGSPQSKRQALTDFNLGFALCILTAAAFLIMGATLIHYQGVTPATGNAPLVRQLLDLYAAALGTWITPFIALGAIAVMASTTITVTDALPRALNAAIHTLTTPADNNTTPPTDRSRAYWLWFTTLTIGGLIIVQAFTSSLAALVDLATTLSFLSTPVLAYLNHKAIFHPTIPPEHRPSRALHAASIIAIVLFTATAIAYIPWYLYIKP